ncbi:MAG: ligand-binding sensor domain-containing protein, partial [Tannerellaceae bacterium]
MNNIFSSRIVFLILYLCFSQFAVAKEYYFKHYRNEQGLSHNTVICTAQDKSGFMWFGTTDGLNRFDGNRFKHYTNIEGDSSSVTSNYIHAIYPDKDGNVWIATSNELCVYTHRDNQFVRFSKLNNQGLIIHAAFNVVEDQSGNIWIASGNRVYKYNVDSHNAEEYNDFKYSIRTISANLSGSVWAIGYDGEIAQYKPQTNEFEHFCDAGDITDGPAYINCAVTDDEYGVWLGSNMNGLFLLSLKDKSVQHIIPSIFVRDIKRVSDHELWIASESGLYIYDLNSKQIKNIRKSLSNPYALADNALYSITKDKEGGVWISSYFKGVSYLPNFHLQFDKYLAERTHEQMCGNTVREISADNSGKVWYATEDNAVSTFDPATGSFTHYPLYSKRGQSITNVHGLAVVNDSVWIGTFNDGIHVLSAKTGKEIAHYEAKNAPGALNSDFVLSFLETRTNKLVVATTNGASFFNPKTQGFDPIDLGFSSLSVYKVFEDSKGLLWFATAAGLVAYDDNTKAAKVYDHSNSGLGSSISNLINYIMEDSKNRLWVATHEGGLALFNRETGKATIYNEHAGIPSAQLYSVLEDGQGSLWIASSKGLIRFNPEKEESYIYTRASGLPENQFNFNSAYKDV